ncbi:MAG TPA: hypothetical protein VMT11_11500 [Myxococcaceae bacterium]|nr:hypothetical protein [Myxococcaceae bacterium]
MTLSSDLASSASKLDAWSGKSAARTSWAAMDAAASGALARSDFSPGKAP